MAYLRRVDDFFKHILTEILSDVSARHDIPLERLMNDYVFPEASTAREPPCPMLTQRGTPCKRGVVPGTGLCKMHGRLMRTAPSETSSSVSESVAGEERDVLCEGYNRSGERCSNRARPGTFLCRKHRHQLYNIPEECVEQELSSK